MLLIDFPPKASFLLALSFGRLKAGCSNITQHLVAYQTAVETRTYSYGMCTHTGHTSRLPCMRTLISAWHVEIIPRYLRITKATLHRLLEEFSFPNPPYIFGSNLSTSTSNPGRFISESVKYFFAETWPRIAKCMRDSY